LNSLRVPDAPATTSLPFQFSGKRRTKRACFVASLANQPSTWMPGTAADDGAGPLEITPRSLVGVNMPKFAGRPATDTPGSGEPSANVVIELSGGVVSLLFVRRSSLRAQT